MTKINQSQIIKQINKYFELQKLSKEIQFDEKGVCRGLSIQYARYFLEGKESEFFKILEIIAKGDAESEEKYGLQPGSINIFAAEIFQAQDADFIDKSYDQDHGMQLLKIDGQSLTSSFDFVLDANDENWAEVLSELNLQEDEVLCMGAAKHSAIVRRENNQYVVYDPNYKLGKKTFSTEEELIKEIHYEIFSADNENLGMGIQLIRHPDVNLHPRAVELPNVMDLYDKYLQPNSMQSDDTYNLLKEASIRVNDEAVIRKLIDILKPTAEQKFNAADHSLNIKALTPLIKDMSKENLCTLIENACAQGNLDAFKFLLKITKPSRKELNFYFCTALAATSGNLQFFKEVFQKTWFKNFSEKNFKDKITNFLKPALKETVKSGYSECVEQLIKYLNMDEINSPLTDKEKLDLLVLAIQHNKPLVVIALIDTEPGISEDLIQKISLSTLAVDKMNLELLEVLHDKKFNFSEQAEEILIDKRKNKGHSFIITCSLIIKCIENFLTGQPLVCYNEQTPLPTSKSSTIGFFVDTEKLETDSPQPSNLDLKR